MNKEKILITGGAGFVGSNLSHYLLSKFNPKKIFIMDNLLSSDISNIPLDPKVEFIFGSISDDKILNKIPSDIDYVFHLSCFHGNQSSIADPLADHENNTLTSLKLFNLIKGQKQIKKIVYSAAGCAVAEKTDNLPNATPEDAPISLFHDSPYSISKIIGEMYGNYFFSRFNMPFVKARFQNVYGPREILGAGVWRGTHHTIWRNVIPTFIWKSLNSEQLPLDNAGLGSRDFIYVQDVVVGLVACALKGLPGEAYNLASGVDTKIIDLATYINKATGNKASFLKKPARDWDNSGRRYGSTSKSEKELNFRAKTDIIKGINETVEWTKKNKSYIQTMIQKHNIFLNA